jgi:hypothetical protein
MLNYERENGTKFEGKGEKRKVETKRKRKNLIHARG